ncbi:MAG: hypothetical protein IT370_14700 [Deltaproteobacteria bacterium]|nr:hypothetical protein [Deltaproteobacteria bacterium]
MTQRFATPMELSTWAEDQGVLDDTLVLGLDPATTSLRLGFRLPSDGASLTPRQRFSATHEELLVFTLTGDGPGAALTITGSPVLPAALTIEGYDWDAPSFAFTLALGDARAHFTAPAVVHEELGTESHPIMRSWEPGALSLHGAGPLEAGVLSAALASRGVAVDLHGNWNSSGQPFGRAFVRDVAAPTAVAPGASLDGWCVTLAGTPATQPAHVWLLGRATPTSTYVTLQRSAASPPALVAALVSVLRAWPGLSWGYSGNRLLESDADAAAWLAAAPPA